METIYNVIEVVGGIIVGMSSYRDKEKAYDNQKLCITGSYPDLVEGWTEEEWQDQLGDTFSQDDYDCIFIESLL